MGSKLKGYIGTYTNGESKGIYSFTLDKESGALENVKLAGELENPTYLAIDKSNKYIYSVTKVGTEGGVASYSINKDGALELINYKVSQGSPPCHVSLDIKNKYLFSGNYHKGTVEVFSIIDDGGIDASVSIATHEGCGPNKERQEKPHVHFVGLTPDEKYLCAVDLGTDKLAVYSFVEGILTEATELSLNFNPECGPRHMTFHPNGKFAYVNTELSGEIIILEYNQSKSGFNILQYISTLPEDFTGENLGSAIHITPDGKYLYAANRGHDSIAAFSIDASSGKLELISHTSTGGSHPRDFEIDPTGSFIVASNMSSNNIISFKIDSSTGKLERVNSEVSIPSPVCIKFLNIK
jgi:6-phosphogluconolactonase